jgi:hypothetical protein
VGKIAGHCDDDCEALRNFAHALAARGSAVAWATRRYAVPRSAMLHIGALPTLRGTGLMESIY